jgi:hypothetical protein
MPWTVTQIVTEVQKRTENRANSLIDMNMEFLLALDEFCQEQHFWWRKRRGSFTTAIGTQSYDLSNVGSKPTDFVEIDEAYLINADGVTVENELIPVIDNEAQLAATLNTVQDTPSSFFIDTQTSPTTLFLQAPSSVAQTIVYTYWAIPQSTNTGLTTIPLVPPYLHWGLVYALERRVYEVLYGQEDPRWQMANARYQEFVAKAARTSWTTQDKAEARTNENYVNTVQAHS